MTTYSTSPDFVAYLVLTWFVRRIIYLYNNATELETESERWLDKPRLIVLVGPISIEKVNVVDCTVRDPNTK